MLPTMCISSPGGNLVTKFKWVQTFISSSFCSFHPADQSMESRLSLGNLQYLPLLSSIINDINVLSRDFKSFWKIVNHQIQPAVMCPVNCTQLCTKGVPLVSVCSCQSQAMPAPYIRSLHCTHHGGRNMCNFQGCCLRLMYEVSWSSCLLTQGLCIFTVFWGIYRSLSSQNPDHIHRLSHLTKPVIRRLASCGKGSAVFRPSQCACHWSVHQCCQSKCQQESTMILKMFSLLPIHWTW